MPIAFTCETCGKQFYRPPSSLKQTVLPKYCSRKCFYAYYKGSRKVSVKCEKCGSEFLVPRIEFDRGTHSKFCSRKCVNIGRVIESRRKEKILCTCMYCGKEFYKLQCQIDAGRGKFCCRACVASHTIRNLDKRTPTSIEQLLIDELKLNNISFEFQYQINSWIIDFAFPESMLAIEADGVYWHGLQNVKEKDARKDNDLAASGWRIIHLSESEIRESPKQCVNLILKNI